MANRNSTEIGQSGVYLFANNNGDAQVRQGTDNTFPLANLQSNYPYLPNHAATFSSIAASLAGIVPDDFIRAASTDVIHSFSKGLEAGSSYDGVTLSIGDWFLVKNQINQHANGLYIIQESGTPLRVDPSALTYNFIYVVLEGNTNAGTFWQSTGSYTGPDDTPVYNVDLIQFTSVPVWPAVPINSGFNGDLLGNHLSDSVNNIVIMGSPIDLNGHYLVDNNTSIVSVNCSFQTSGTIASGGNIGLPNESAIYFATMGDPNWKMGRDIGAFSMTMITSNALQVSVADSEGEGFAVGVHEGQSILEFGSNGNTYVRNDIEAATYSTHDEYFTYNGAQFIVNLVDDWGGLQVLGRSGGEASIAIRPDNVEPGSAGTWAIVTHGSDMVAPADFAIYNAGADTQPFYISESTNFIGINNNNPAYQLDVIGDISVTTAIQSSIYIDINDNCSAGMVVGNLPPFIYFDSIQGSAHICESEEGTVNAINGVFDALDDGDYPSVVSIIQDEAGDLTGMLSTFDYFFPVTFIGANTGDDGGYGIWTAISPVGFNISNEPYFGTTYFSVTSEGETFTANNTLDDGDGNAYIQTAMGIGNLADIGYLTSPLGFGTDIADKMNIYSTGNANDMHGIALKSTTLAFIVPGDGHYFGFYGRTDGTDTQVAYIDSSGNAQFNGYLEVNSGAEMISPVPESALYTGMVIGDNTSIVVGDFFGSFFETRNSVTDEISGCGVTPGGLSINASFGSPSANLYYQDGDENVAFVQTANNFDVPLATSGSFYIDSPAEGMLLTVGPDELSITDNVYENYYLDMYPDGTIYTLNNTLDDGDGGIYINGNLAINASLESVTAPLTFALETGEKINLWGSGNLNDTYGIALKDSTVAFIAPSPGRYFGFYGRAVDNTDTQVAYITTEGDANFNGNVNAATFTGDGSALTGVTSTVAPAGTPGQLQYNDSGSTGALISFTDGLFLQLFGFGDLTDGIALEIGESNQSNSGTINAQFQLSSCTGGDTPVGFSFVHNVDESTGYYRVGYNGYYGNNDFVESYNIGIDGSFSSVGFFAASNGGVMYEEDPDYPSLSMVVLSGYNELVSTLGNYYGATNYVFHEDGQVGFSGATEGIGPGAGSPTAMMGYQDASSNIAFWQAASQDGGPTLTAVNFLIDDVAAGMQLTIWNNEFSVTDPVYDNYYLDVNTDGSVYTINNTLDDGSGSMWVDSTMWANQIQGNGLAISGALADGTYTCGTTGSITITNGVITAIS